MEIHEVPNHPRFKNLASKQFGDWTVESYAGKPGRLQRWNCRCKCGAVSVLSGVSLTGGRSTQCVECGKKHMRQVKRKDKHHNRLEYNSWRAMKQRCYCPNNVGHKSYGGQGVQVCDRWRNSFEAFLKDMGPKPSPTHSIERIKNNIGYEPGNCRWATKTEQARNRSNNRIIIFKEESLCVSAWSEKTGLSVGTILYRLGRGWGDEKTLSTPPRQYRPKK